MGKFQINIIDNTDIDVAFSCVKSVIKRGRVSQGRYRKVYCWATVFEGIGKQAGREVVVVTRDTAKVDCFDVYTKDKR